MARHPVLAAGLMVLLLGLLAACAGEGAEEQTPSPPDEESREEGPRELSRRFREALGQGDVEAASEALARLARTGDGALVVGSRRLPVSSARAALVDAALRASRARASSMPPDLPGARAAVAVAAAHAAPEDDARVEGHRRWASLSALDDLPGPPAPHDGPRVVLYADDFHLGEALLGSVLGRWAREGRAGGLRVGMVPVRRGTVRAGLRRVPADPRAELAAVRRDAGRAGLVLEPAVLDAEAARRALGLGDLEAALVVVDREGRVVGRMIAAIPDPRPLEPLVQKVASR